MRDNLSDNSTNAYLAIIGGMGPAAGIDFYKKLVDASNAKKDQDHIDTIIYSYASKIPDRTSYLNNQNEQNPAFFINKLIDDATIRGVKYACMPCITSHAGKILTVIQKHIEMSGNKIILINILDVINEWCSNVIVSGGSVGIIATKGTITHKVIEKHLSKIGIDCINPKVPEQTDAVHDSIYNEYWGIKSANCDINKVRSVLFQVIDNLIDRGAKAIILGCTELPLVIAEKDYKNIPILDPTKQMALRITENYYV
jgi:aspartate racemase